MEGRRVPDVVLKTRVRDESIGGDNPYRWQDVSTHELFEGRRVVVFALPGAFTPTCTNEQCPAFELLYDDLRAAGVDEVYCLSVNDAFVMHQWGRHLGLKKVRLLPDGSGAFTRRMGMLINKEHLGFGYRSWRYAMVVRDGVIEKWLEEPGVNDEGMDDDPYGASDPKVVLEYLRGAGAGILEMAAPTGGSAQVGELRSFQADADAPGKPDGASGVSRNEGRLGPAANPVEGKR